MKSKTKKLVIFGLEDFADIAFEYFTHDSSYEVVGFTANSEYIESPTKWGLPVIPFENLVDYFPPNQCEIFVAVVYAQLNRLRERICQQAKDLGYSLASYISSRAFVWPNVEMGEHCFIFEDNTIQPFVSIGKNVVLWSGNHIGHHSKIGNHCFITSQAVVSGWCTIGDYTFLGVNSTLANNTKVGSKCWVGHGTTLAGIIPDGSLVKSPTSEISELNETALFRALSRSSKSRNS